MNKTRAYRAVTNSVGQLTCSFVLLWPVHSFADVQSANASGSSGLEEIVVTATRQPETAQRTALAIGVIRIRSRGEGRHAAEGSLCGGPGVEHLDAG
jgi:hypothetical protein